MNLKEITVEELELHDALVDEGIAAIVHTILFLRAPNIVKPEDHVCERLAPLRYAKCGPIDVDDTVAEVVQTLRSSLTSVGPHLSKGIVLVSFFERREVKGFFGLVSNQENVYFERWRIPVVVDQRPLLAFNPQYHPQTHGAAADHERRHLFDTARDIVHRRLITILEAVNTSTDHVPPTMYEYEVESTGPWGEKRDQNNVVTRLINSGTVSS